jgi:hypothetical protein
MAGKISIERRRFLKGAASAAVSQAQENDVPSRPERLCGMEKAAFNPRSSVIPAHGFSGRKR